MGKPSKEEKVLELFLNQPSRHWHFIDIAKAANISEPAANKWLKKLLDERIIIHIKPKGKMPYFQGNYTHPDYQNKKKIYALQKLYETGLLTKLQNLKKARIIIIFGSYIRWDWNINSDIDIFVLGDPEDLRYGGLWSGLGIHGKAREIQMHNYKSEEKIQPGLMKNIIKGYFVKGNINDIIKMKT